MLCVLFLIAIIIIIMFVSMMVVVVVVVVVRPVAISSIYMKERIHWKTSSYHLFLTFCIILYALF
jgi:hypothetical protein